VGIAKEQRAPDRQPRADPAEQRPQPEQDQARQREGADEWQALAVNRHDRATDRGENGHVYSAASARSIGGSRAPSSISGGLRWGAAASSSTWASFSRAASASRCRFHMLA